MSGRGVDRREVRAEVTGLVEARLTGPASSDWDVAVFEARRPQG